MRTFGVYQTEPNDETMFGMPDMQLIFQVCDECNCITVSNQCS